MRGKALVTGCEGFIGRALSTKLQSIGVEVVGLDIKSGSHFSVEDKNFLQRFVDYGFDYIFHFGAPCSILQYNKEPEKCMKHTVVGFQNVLDLAKISQAKLIYPSSGNVYGGSNNPPYSEFQDAEPANLYGVGKFICERMAISTKVDSTGFRIFTGYGPGEERKRGLASVIYQFLSTMKRHESPVIWGDGEQQRDCLFIDDIVDACIKVMNVDTPKILNLGTGVCTTYNQMIDVINEVLGYDIVPEYVSKPSKYIDKAVADTKLMQEYVDIRPLSLKEGIKKFSEYLDENNRKN